MNTKRKKQVCFRLTEDEFQLLQTKVIESGKNQQEYLRRAALNMPITNLDPLKYMLPEMKRQGANLNQVAKRLNERGYVDYGSELKKTQQEVRETWQSLKQFLLTHQ